MIRRIIHIDEEKCNGCGLCAAACHEGAIGMVNGKARLLRDDYCDGLGDCLPACPAGAITFVERAAAAYDEKAVLANKAAKASGQPHGGCPGSMAASISHKESAVPVSAPGISRLSQWPVQIKLAPISSPYFHEASLLIAADCTAYAYGNFHEDFIRGRVTLIGCPKLDSVQYSEKLTEILKNNEIKDITVARMVVPCCGGIEYAVKEAVKNSGRAIPVQVITISTDGTILARS